jgi:abortive infection bacteriophage resistance protein
MKYEKPALTFEELADKLLRRGMIADYGDLIAKLKVTSYFRLSAYLYPFRNGDDALKPGTTLAAVQRLYDFDQRLRTSVLDAIESIEVHARTQLAHHFAHRHGPFAYLDPANFPNFDMDKGDFDRWERKLKEQMNRGRQPKGKEDFVLHFYRKYGDSEDLLPIWMIAELMDFGSTLSFFRGVDNRIKKTMAAELGQPEEVVFSWLLSLNAIRNRCAHHARLWNWTIGYPVLIPALRKNPDWHVVRIANDRLGIILTICCHWLKRIGLKADWASGIVALIDEYPEIHPSDLGMPVDWRKHPVWIASVERSV